LQSAEKKQHFRSQEVWSEMPRNHFYSGT
jgi:hypothetical protein